MTVTELITRSLRKIGAIDGGAAPTTDELTDGIDVLNDVLLQWSVQSFGIHKTAVVSHTLTESDGTYTIGATGDIVTARPVRIISAYVRRNDIDYLVDIRSNTYMDSVQQKTLETIPRDLQYEETYPNGTISIFPLPDNSTDVLYLRVWQILDSYSDGTDDIDLPPEYLTALVYNVARDYASEFEIQVPQNVIARSEETLRILRSLHANPVPVVKTNAAQVGRPNYYNYDITTG